MNKRQKFGILVTLIGILLLILSVLTDAPGVLGAAIGCLIMAPLIATGIWDKIMGR